MESSDHPCDSTEQNQNVEENQSLEEKQNVEENHSLEENQSVVTEPSASSIPANNNSEADSDFMGKNAVVLAEGLSAMLSTVIRDFDGRAQETLKSQDELFLALDRLTRELDQLLEDAPLPFIMQHAAKLCSVRTRVSSLNSLLKTIQGRIDNIDRMLTRHNAHE